MLTPHGADMVEMLSIHTLERYLDCLDGHLARRYNMCTTAGHYMDKSTDFVFRWTCVGVMCTQRTRGSSFTIVQPLFS